MVPALKNGERSGGRWRGLWVRNMFVLGGIAISVVLVTASTLMVELSSREGIDLGSNVRKQLVFFDLSPGVAGYDAQRSIELFESVAENTRAVPGVVRASSHAGASVGLGRRRGTTRSIPGCRCRRRRPTSESSSTRLLQGISRQSALGY